MIKWITKELGVAKRSDVKEGVYRIIDVRDMVDKKGNSKELIIRKINTAIEIIKKKHKVVICCDYGLSRSNAIAVGVLIKYYGYNFEEAVKHLIKKTRKKTIQLEVLNSIRSISELKNSKPRNKRTILMIGKNNFIGKNLTSLLKNKYNLIVLTDSEIDLTKSPIELSLKVKKYGVGLIVYLSDPTAHTTNQTMGQMIVSLKNILEVCKENKMPIVYISSNAVFSGYKKTMRASENLSPRPGDTYGEAKMICEYLLDYYKKSYGLGVCLLRLGRVYGRGCNRTEFIKGFFEKARNNLPIYVHKYKNGFPILDLVHSKDVAGAINIAIKRNFYGTLHIGSGNGISTFKLAQKIKKFYNSKSEISFSKINNYNGNIIMNISKALKNIGWSPKINIDEGLAEFINKP